MSCCGSEFRYGTCDVCKVTSKDNSIKLVRFCRVCNAYICSSCEGKYLNRFIAMVATKSEDFIKWVKDAVSGH